MDRVFVEGMITVEGAKIGFRNFRGLGSQYNREGTRNFVVFFKHEEAVRLKNIGWNIKFTKPRDEEDVTPDGFLPVEVKYGNRPPKVVLKSYKGLQELDEESVGVLDKADISNVDLIINPSNWELPDGKWGTKAYLKTMYVTLETDVFSAKYETPDEDSNDILV